MDTDCHCVNYLSRRDPKIDGPQCGSSPIVIEDDVLIGTRCIILKGVTIGARSIIAAGSVVTKSIPSDSIAAGNPAKVVRILK
nr:DapH/DapD/GlmU-related protein [Bacteroides caecigallinarum]